MSPARATHLGGSAHRQERRPTLTDLTLLLSSAVDADDVNDELRSAAEGPLAGVLSYSTGPLVSRDIIGDPRPASSTHP